MSKKFYLVLLAIFGVSYAACITREASSPTPVTRPPQEKVNTDLKAPWQIEWDKTLRAARNERRVVVYAATPAPAIKEAISILRDKFGLELEVLGSRGPELTPRILQEKAAGLHIVDVAIAGPATVLRGIKAAGKTVPLQPALILPEVLDPKGWFGEQLPWIDRDRHALSFYMYPSPMLAINTELVKAGEIKSYYDLLDLRWKDKILVYDPSVSGSGSNGLNSLIVNKVVDWDFFRQLVSMQSMMTRSGRLHSEWLARGKYPVALWPHSSELAEFIKSGAPVVPIELKEGTYLSADGAATVMIERAPHPNAARIFVNWLLSREGQQLMQDFLITQSARADISTEKLDPLRTRTKGRTYFRSANDDEQWVLEEQEKYYEMIKKVFTPLLK